MPIPSTTVTVPIVKGLDITTDDRLLQAPSLLEATNSRFGGGGAKKRRGHTAARVKISGPFGDPEYVRPSGDEDVDFWNSATGYPEELLGTFSRDSETIAWDGVRAYSYLPSQQGAPDPVFTSVSPASLPSFSSAPTAKHNEHQGNPEMADNGLTRVVAWINGDSEARYAIYDSDSGAQITSGTLAVATADYLRCFTLGETMHIIVRDADDDLAKLFSIASAQPEDITYRSYGPATHFDLWKHSETLALLARTGPDGINVNWIAPGGGGSSERTQQVYTPLGVATLISCAAEEDGEIVLAYTYSGGIGVAFLTDSTLVTEDTVVASGVERLTIAPRGSVTFEDNRIYDLFWDDGEDINRVRVWSNGQGTPQVRYHLTLASRAFYYNDRTFVWAGYTSGLGVQSTWFLLDEALLPVGKCDFAVANVELQDGRLAGINWVEEVEPHLALSYKLRVENTSANVTDGIYTEPSVRGIYLNLRPELRAAQAGRATYIAGAQLWAYDGRELTEAGFHLGPEATLTQHVGGALTADGTYSYRVDLCHRNAQNEEVRSLSILTDSIELSGSNQTITVHFDTVLTRRTNSYFLIYRNAMSSGVPLVNWWLLNSRDPNDPSYLPNDLSVENYSVTDSGVVDDTEIQVRELHPASDTYVQPISAPACEVIAAGRDRLWVAGGELLPGQVAPSRLFEPGDCPTFNPYLAIQVDRSNEPVTAIGFIGEVGVFFRPNSTYLLDSDGPDNNASGTWNPPRLALADIGAVSQASVARIIQGLIFQSPAGFRVIGPGGALTPIGQPVDDLAEDLDIVGSIVVEKDQEVRFYTADEALVYNYLYDTWSLWTCGAVGVTKGTNGLAILAQADGNLWVEETNVWTDAGGTYPHRIRTSWLHGGNLGEFQRVRRVGGVGRYADLDNPTHNLRLELFYDSREFWEDRHEWTFPDSTTNQDLFGNESWGAGVWGDTSAEVANLEDLSWDWERDPAVQKCNSISIALEDPATVGPGFELSAFTLELARKPGLNRGPTRTGTGSYRSNE